MAKLSASHFNLFLHPNFLDARECARLIDELRSSPTTQAPVYIENSDTLVHEDIRKTTSLHPSDETFSVLHRRLFEQKSALEEHFGQPLRDCERPQFLRYGKGDFFVRHQDGNTEQLEFDHLRIRKISLIAFLNDHAVQPDENCFSGGSLNFYDQDDPSPGGPVAFPLLGETGLLVAFTAETMHGVAPVTSGERFTVISWFR
ncbi:MAG TPA: 2OG-Fe(II) oxygenase [Pyrinomonadaceae bacterium]|jgi:SM-20-related protein